MANYSDEEKRAFKEKDKLNARMSALKAATVNQEGLSKPHEDILKEAQEYYNWLYPNADDNPEVTPRNDTQSDMSLRAPVVVVDAICGEYVKMCPSGYKVNTELVKSKIIEKFDQLPTRIESVEKVLKEIPVDNVIKKERSIGYGYDT